MKKKLSFLSQEDLSVIKSATLPFRALNHKLRQQILASIDEAQRKGKKICVTDIYVNLREEQSVISQHLAILRKVGVVKTERNGKFIYYFVDKNKVREIVGKAKELAGIK